MTKGIKIAKPGHDVSERGRHMILTSEFPGSMKIHGRVKITLTSTYAGEPDPMVITSVYPHGLAYTPAFLATVHSSKNGATYKIPFFSSTTASLKVHVDETNLYVSVVSVEASTYTFNIIVLAEPLDDGLDFG